MKYQQYKFSGGISAGSRSGYTGAYQDGIGIDIRTDPDSIQSNRKLVKESGTTVTGLVKWMVEYNSDIWMYDNAGKIYKRTSAGVYTNPHTAGTSTGQGMATFTSLNTDALWYASSTTIGRGISLSGSGTWDDDYIRTADLNIDQSYLPATTATYYTTPSSISETATNRQSFIPAKSKLEAISMLVATKGNGNIVLTLHDEANTNLGSVTATIAGVTNNAYYKFTFSSTINLIPNGNYHFHVTVPSGTATTFNTDTSTDMEGCQFKTYYPVLNADTDYHPMKEFVNLLCIGNGNYLATLDDLELYNGERLQFAGGERVRCLEVIGGSIFIATWKGTSIGDYETSKLYTWDGISPSWNDVIEVSGQINALKNAGNNMLYIIHGTQNDISLYTGGITPIRPMKYIGKGKSVETFPSATTVHNKIFYYGISDGTSTTADRVIYGYGTKNKDYPVAWTKDYILSTGRMGSTIQVGCLLGTNASTFLVSWKDGSSYGVDNISSTQDQQDSYVKGLIFDRPEIHQIKQSTSLSIRHNPLGVDQSIEVWYRRDSLDEESSADELVDNEGFALLGVSDGNTDDKIFYSSFAFNKKWFQLELKIRLKTMGTDSPVFYSWEVPFELVQNTQYGKVSDHE